MKVLSLDHHQLRVRWTPWNYVSMYLGPICLTKCSVALRTMEDNNILQEMSGKQGNTSPIRYLNPHNVVRKLSPVSLKSLFCPHNYFLWLLLSLREFLPTKCTSRITKGSMKVQICTTVHLKGLRWDLRLQNTMHCWLMTTC